MPIPHAHPFSTNGTVTGQIKAHKNITPDLYMTFIQQIGLTVKHPTLYLKIVRSILFLIIVCTVSYITIFTDHPHIQLCFKIITADITTTSNVFFPQCGTIARTVIERQFLKLPTQLCPCCGFQEKIPTLDDYE